MFKATPFIQLHFLQYQASSLTMQPLSPDEEAVLAKLLFHYEIVEPFTLARQSCVKQAMISLQGMAEF